mmetsp:Transcript_5444/g.7133  ORF Transcript_5444/g.7133 Transcript_5444/m.7133 type:complete len:148 (-) Transcript_5444:584-1027(-)
MIAKALNITAKYHKEESISNNGAYTGRAGQYWYHEHNNHLPDFRKIGVKSFIVHMVSIFHLFIDSSSLAPFSRLFIYVDKRSKWQENIRFFFHLLSCIKSCSIIPITNKVNLFRGFRRTPALTAPSRVLKQTIDLLQRFFTCITPSN